MSDLARKREFCHCMVCERPATLILEPDERQGSGEPEVVLACDDCVKMMVWDGDYLPESVQFYEGAQVRYALIKGQVWVRRRVTT